jgi:hypothetical protein
LIVINGLFQSIKGNTPIVLDTVLPYLVYDRSNGLTFLLSILSVPSGQVIALPVKKLLHGTFYITISGLAFVADYIISICAIKFSAFV